MAHNQGGLNSIESISGVTPPATSAVEKITLTGTDYDYSRTQQTNNNNSFLSLTSAGHRVNFSGATFDQMFNDENYVGGNMLTSEEIMHQRYMDSGAGMKFYGMG